MATIEDIGLQAINFMSQTFGLPKAWFAGPLLLFNFFIPLIGLVFVWYTFLHKRLGIFHRSEFANFMIALLIALMSTPIIALLTPTLTLAIAIGAGALLWGRFSLLRIILVGLISWGLTFFYPLLINLVLSAFPV